MFQLTGHSLFPSQNLARARAAAFTGDNSVVHSHARNDGQTDVLVSEKRESSTAVKQSSARGL
jgi:hypothetical protein